MLKMVMVVYNEAIDAEVMEVLGACTMRNYTKVPGVFGRGLSSGTHLGNDIWPGRNTMLYIACLEEQARHIVSCVKELKRKLGSEGVKAFVSPLDEVS